MRPTEIETLLAKLDGSGSDAEWTAILQLRTLDHLPELLLAKYQRSKHFGARAACVYHCLRHASKNESAFKLGLAATEDRSKVVRNRAAMLLAVAQNAAAIPALESMKTRYKESAADAEAAIKAIKNRDPNLYVDRKNSGMVTLNIR
jgi:hypothetical protein